MPFLAVDTIIGNQALRNGRYCTCSSLGLDLVETGFNLVIDWYALTKWLIIQIQG